MSLSAILLLVWEAVQRKWLPISGVFLFLGFLVAAFAIWRNAIHLRKRMIETHVYMAAWLPYKQDGVAMPGNRVFRYVAMHLGSLFTLDTSRLNIASRWFVLGSLGLGIFAGYKATSVYVLWQGDLPYNSFSIILPIVAGVFVGCLPFLLLHALVESRRVKLSHSLLEYTEELERQYLTFESMRPALETLALQTGGQLQDLTYRLVHALQRGKVDRILDVLELLKHQIGTRFAATLAVLIREGSGVGEPYAKDVRIGLRSLIEKMHLQRQAYEADRPEKRQIWWIGMATFPVLYGTHEYSLRMLKEKSNHYLFEVPSQMTLFILSLSVGLTAIALNMLLGRRKLDL